MNTALAVIDSLLGIGSAPALRQDTHIAAPAASYGRVGWGSSYVISYTGEKNGGAAGPIVEYNIDHYALRMRSFQLLLESEVCVIVFNKYCTWCIGEGLQLQANPKKLVLQSEGIRGLEGDWEEEFNELAEARFGMYADNEMADWADMETLNVMENRAHMEAIVGGDVLVVHRIQKGVLKVQLIDGGLVRTPLGSGWVSLMGAEVVNQDTGNRIRHGVEIDAKGQHVAYWVQKSASGIDALNYTRIPARGARSGALMAYLVYGNKYRLDHVRGVPLIAAVIETAKIMERYKGATVSSAEERAKLPYFIEHGITSTGEDPRIKQYMKQKAGFVNPEEIEAAKSSISELQNTVYATMNKMVYNLPNDSTIKVPDSKMELAFSDFYDTNFNYFAATLQIPPEVALSMYNSNYSASRAAVKDWEHTLKVMRKRFSRQFKQRIYNTWLDVEVMKNRIQLPGYLQALSDGNEMAMAAYRNARWEGSKVPSIDPVKEAEYLRTLLGPAFDHVPLITGEMATDAVDGGDFTANVQQAANELQRVKDAGIEPPVEQGNNGTQDGTNGGEEPTKPVKKGRTHRPQPKK